MFDFGIIHHIPNWRDALAEVARVLKPGGRFFFGLHVGDRWRTRVGGDYLLGVATKPDPDKGDR